MFSKKWQARLDAFYEERLSFQADQLKILREVYESKAKVQDERIAMLEARIANLDGWVQTVAVTKGLGQPVPFASEGGIEDVGDPLPEDLEADMSLEALLPSLFAADEDNDSSVPETEVGDGE